MVLGQIKGMQTIEGHGKFIEKTMGNYFPLKLKM